VHSASPCWPVPIELGQLRFIRANLGRYRRLQLICFSWQLLFVRAVLSFVVVGLVAASVVHSIGLFCWPVSKKGNRVSGNITSRSTGQPYAPPVFVHALSRIFAQTPALLRAAR